MKKIMFNDETIQEIFGHEAAENEDISKLIDYYFKNTVYDSVKANLPLRILVGHKGIGKSALLKVAHNNDIKDGIISIFLKNNDISLSDRINDFNRMINEYKKKILEIIYLKMIEEYRVGEENPNSFDYLKSKTVGFIKYLLHTLDPLLKDNKIVDVKVGVVKNFLNNSEKKIKVYIDDLDRGWSADRNAVAQLSALINALRDLSSENSGLYFKIALRSDVYFLVRTSDESTDKIESSVVWHTWTNHEILALLTKRIERFNGIISNDDSLVLKSQKELARKISNVIEYEFNGKGKWEKIPTYRMLMTLIRRRPRDLIKLCTLAANETKNRKGNIINSKDFSSVFDNYSQGRLQDTINEYSTEMFNLSELLLNMRKAKKDNCLSGNIYNTSQLNEKINKILSMCDIKFYGSRIKPKASDVAAFLYKIGFITARKNIENKIIRKYFEDARYIRPSMLDSGYLWEIHPAFRWALESDNSDKMMEQIAPVDEFEE